MKIFSNFDTKFRQRVLDKKGQIFPPEKILLIRRSKYYLLFIVLFRFIGYISLLIMMYLFFMYIKVPLIFYIGGMTIWVIVVWFKIIHKLLKYKYDFTIVTPTGVMTYKQKGILHSVAKEIPSKRVIAIEVSSTTFLGSIFGYGHVDIVSDMSVHTHLGEDDEASSIIGMTYVDHSYEIKEKITELCFE